MKTIKILLFCSLLIITLQNIVYSQYSFEGIYNLELNTRSQPLNYKMYLFDAAYDNYGLNFVGIHNVSSPASETVNYYLIGNDGVIQDQITGLGGDLHNSGVCIGSYKGKVYVVTRQETPSFKFKVYEKINGVNSFVLKATIIPSHIILK